MKLRTEHVVFGLLGSVSKWCTPRVRPLNDLIKHTLRVNVNIQACTITLRSDSVPTDLSIRLLSHVNGRHLV